MTTDEKLALALAALKRAQEDVNWMLNNQRLLNPDVFDYLHDAVDAIAD